VDFRALNAVTQFDTYPLPLIEQASLPLHGSKYLTTIDMYSAFWHVKIAPEDKMKKSIFNPVRTLSFSEIPFWFG
jgi:hypothetical protein